MFFFMMKLNYMLYLIFLMMMYLFFMNIFKIHPMMMSLLLVIYVTILCLKMNFMKNNFWFSYILFLVMVGGVMILFMYFTSILNNEKFLYVNNYMLIDFLLMFLYLLILVYNFNNFSLNFFGNEFNNYNIYKSGIYMIKSLYMNLYMDMNIFLMFYLLFMMICAVLICLKYFIPMRKMN